MLASIIICTNQMLGIHGEDPSHPFGTHSLQFPSTKNHLPIDLNTDVPAMTSILIHVAHLCKINTIKVCCKDAKVAIWEFNT